MSEQSTDPPQSSDSYSSSNEDDDHSRRPTYLQPSTTHIISSLHALKNLVLSHPLIRVYPTLATQHCRLGSFPFLFNQIQLIYLQRRSNRFVLLRPSQPFA